MWNPLHSQGGGVKCEVCRKAQSWGPLGFVAEIKVRSNAQNASGKFDLNHVCRAFNEHTGVYVHFPQQEHVSETYDVCASYILLYT
jgi:hypothetical protein